MEWAPFVRVTVFADNVFGFAFKGCLSVFQVFFQFYCNSCFHNICIDFTCRSLLIQLPLIEEMCSNLCPSRSIIQKMMVKNLIEFVNKFYKFPHTHTDVMYRKPLAFWICIAMKLHIVHCHYRVALVVVYAVCTIVCIPYPSSQNDADV